MANEARGIDLYNKLHKCLKIALTAPTQKNGDELSCHANNIIRNLAKSIESGETWYDPTVEIWCDYFIGKHDKEATVFEAITKDAATLAGVLGSLPVLEAPWDDAFHKQYCAGCEADNCDAENCPHNAFRSNPEWWLSLKAEVAEL